ncbi:hypothetical protein U9M48_039028 [Paspalum notatum var. saurae]|uniref:Uncharacterized protein n=1 Tax=Paspalum notatum var. saurae TaxID=547442 RepID=A0AAQ3UMS5_PASNO
MSGEEDLVDTSLIHMDAEAEAASKESEDDQLMDDDRGAENEEAELEDADDEDGKDIICAKKPSHLVFGNSNIKESDFKYYKEMNFIRDISCCRRPAHEFAAFGVIPLRNKFSLPKPKGTIDPLKLIQLPYKFRPISKDKSPTKGWRINVEKTVDLMLGNYTKFEYKRLRQAFGAHPKLRKKQIFDAFGIDYPNYKHYELDTKNPSRKVVKRKASDAPGVGTSKLEASAKKRVKIGAKKKKPEAPRVFHEQSSSPQKVSGPPLETPVVVEKKRLDKEAPVPSTSRGVTSEVDKIMGSMIGSIGPSHVLSPLDSTIIRLAHRTSSPTYSERLPRIAFSYASAYDEESTRASPRYEGALEDKGTTHMAPSNMRIPIGDFDGRQSAIETSDKGKETEKEKEKEKDKEKEKERKSASDDIARVLANLHEKEPEDSSSGHSYENVYGELPATGYRGLLHIIDTEDGLILAKSLPKRMLLEGSTIDAKIDSLEKKVKDNGQALQELSTEITLQRKQVKLLEYANLVLRDELSQQANAASEANILAREKEARQVAADMVEVLKRLSPNKNLRRLTFRRK